MLIRLLLIGVGAVVAADAVNQTLLGIWRMPPTTVTISTSSPTSTNVPKKPATYRQIVARNIFNSGPVTVAPVISAEGDVAPVEIVEPLNLRVRLTGTVVASAAEQSYAIIRDLTGNKEQLYRVGDRILEEAVVANIQRDSVRLTRGSAEQILRLFEDKNKKPPTGRNPAVQVATAVNGDESRVIDRAEIDNALSDLPRLLTQARLLPNFRAGVTNGFRIFNIVPGSLFAKIGLRNGDVLHRINEVEIRDPTKFMGLFTDLRNQSQITLDLVRGGEKKSFEYEIR